MAEQILTGQKISQLNLKDDERYHKTMVYCWKLIGLSPENYPNGVDYTIITNHITKHYGSLTLYEIRTAFDLATSGELGVDVDHYQTFSAAYLSKIVNSFLEYRKSVIRVINKERQELEIQSRQLTHEQNIELQKRFLYNAIAVPYYKFLETGDIDFGIVSINQIYITLEDLGRIKWSSEKKQELYKKVAKGIDNLMIVKTSNMTNNTKSEDKIKDRIKKAISREDLNTRKLLIQEECRRIVLFDFFEIHKKKEQDILVTLGIKEWVLSKNSNGGKSSK